MRCQTSLSRRDTPQPNIDRRSFSSITSIQCTMYSPSPISLSYEFQIVDTNSFATTMGAGGRLVSNIPSLFMMKCRAPLISRDTSDAPGSGRVALPEFVMCVMYDVSVSHSYSGCCDRLLQPHPLSSIEDEGEKAMSDCAVPDTAILCRKPVAAEM